MEALIGVVIRVSVIYLYTLAILRLSGKRSIASVSPQDFIVAVIIGDMFDDIFWAEVPLWKGVTGITAIIVTHILTSFAVYKSRLIAGIIEPPQVVVIKNARVDEQNLIRERLSKDELMEELRLLGESDETDIEHGQIEPSGQLSIKKRRAVRPLQKRDLGLLKELLP